MAVEHCTGGRTAMVRRWAILALVYIAGVIAVGLGAMVAASRLTSPQTTVREVLGLSMLPPSVSAVACDGSSAARALACEFRVSTDDLPALLGGRTWHLADGVLVSSAPMVRTHRQIRMTLDPSRTQVHLEVGVPSGWRSF